MHQNDCEHTHTHTHSQKLTNTHTCRAVLAVREVSCVRSRWGQIERSRAPRPIWWFAQCSRLHAALNLLYVRVCLCTIRGVPCMPTVTADPAWQQAGAGGRGVPLRDSITALFVKQSWQPGERGGERMSKARGFKGRGVKISTKEIQEVVISTKQTGSQGRGSGHNMGGCSISSELCSVNHCTAWAAIYMRSSMYGY